MASQTQDEVVAMSSDDSLTCTPCERDGEHQPACGFCQDCSEHICRVCCKYHRRFFPAHRILGSSTMPKRKPTPKPMKPSGQTVPCPKHSDNMLEFLCQDHEVVVCYACATTDHCQCQKKFIPDISEEYVKGVLFEMKIQRMKSLQMASRISQDVTREQKEILFKACNEAIIDTDNYRQEIYSTVDSWYTDVMCTIEDKRLSGEIEIKEITDGCASVETDLIKHLSRFDHLNEIDKYDRLFVELMQYQPVIDEYDDKLKRFVEMEITSNVSLDPNTLNQKSFLAKLTSSGKKINQYATFNTSMKTKLLFQRNVNVKGPRDNFDCKITGIDVISPKEIIVADFANKGVKLIDIALNKINDDLNFKFPPTDVAVLSEKKEVVVALLQQTLNNVAILGYSNKLTVKRMVMSENYQSISFANKTFAVTDAMNGNLKLLDENFRAFEGRKFWETTIGHRNHYSMQTSRLYDGDQPRAALSKNGEHIFISDTNAVVKTDREINEVGRYEDNDLQKPMGIAVCEDGSFFVCCQKTNTIHHVSENCKKIHVMSTQECVQCPLSLCVSGNSELIVSCESTKNKSCNALAIFKPQIVVRKS